MLKRGATLTFAAPAAGRLTVRWYATVPAAAGRRAHRVLVAEGSTAARHADADVHVTLSRAGRTLLRAARGPVKVTAVATFAPRIGPAVGVTRMLTVG